MRRPHARLDASSRSEKAEKVRVLLSRRHELAGARALDIGTGGGFVASVLSRSVGPTGEVWAVDQTDQRQVTEGFRFVSVSDVRLPFKDESFDVVVSNHVIEHVGSHRVQLHHLAEVRRVLREGGLAYIATPSRWAIIEPHFHLPFLSWLPVKARSTFVRLMGKGNHYDCEPLSYREITQMFARTDLRFDDVIVEAMRTMAAVEDAVSVRRFVLNTPTWLVRPVRMLVPTMVFVVQRGHS